VVASRKVRFMIMRVTCMTFVSFYARFCFCFHGTMNVTLILWPNVNLAEYRPVFHKVLFSDGCGLHTHYVMPLLLPVTCL
jgi:hypothetical protein